MDKDELKGKVDDAAGRIKRQAGEWTGDEKLQSEGLMDQAKGKLEKGVGKVKEAGRDLADKATGDDDKVRRDERDEEVA
jgi:uncharacterized protein YjbJ (UPF0337 family)